MLHSLSTCTHWRINHRKVQKDNCQELRSACLYASLYTFQMHKGIYKGYHLTTHTTLYTNGGLSRRAGCDKGRWRFMRAAMRSRIWHNGGVTQSLRGSGGAESSMPQGRKGAERAGGAGGGRCSLIIRLPPPADPDRGGLLTGLNLLTGVIVCHRLPSTACRRPCR